MYRCSPRHPPHGAPVLATSPTAWCTGARHVIQHILHQCSPHHSVTVPAASHHSTTQCTVPRVTRYDPISIWEIDMGDRYGRSDIHDISIGIEIWDMCYRYGIWYIDMVIYHIDMVILYFDMGYGLMTWEMTTSRLSSPISTWDILSHCYAPPWPSARHGAWRAPPPPPRGLHSSTSRLNISTLCGIRWAHGFPPVYWTGGHGEVCPKWLRLS